MVNYIIKKRCIINITKFTEIFSWKNIEAFCTAKAPQILSTKKKNKQKNLAYLRY